MSHEISVRKDGFVEMAYRAGTAAPWWTGMGGLNGNIVPEDADLERWTILAGMDFKIGRAKVQYELGEEMRTISTRDVLYREDTGAWLGIVSDRYQPVQPRQVMEFYRELIEAMGFKLETAGVLYGGRKYWALARITEDCAIADLKDKVGMFLLLTTSADGTLATQWRYTAIRVVCQNTLTIAVNQGKAHFSLPHSAEFNPDAAKEAMGLTTKAAAGRFEHTLDAFRQMAETPMTEIDMLKMAIKVLHPRSDLAQMSKKEREEMIERPNVQALGRLAGGNGLLGADFEGGKGTAWSFLNSVTQWVDREKGNGRSNLSTRLDSAWMGEGDRIKRRAFNFLADFSGLNLGGEAEETDGQMDEEMADA